MSAYIKAPNSYFTGQIGETSVQKIFYNNNVACNSLGQADFGEDILCDIFSSSSGHDAYVRTRFSFRVQVKSTASIQKGSYIRRNKNGMSFSLPTGLLQFWQQSFYPVVLVIWDRSTDSGYWCFPVEQLDQSKLYQKTFTVYIDSSHRFDDTGVESIKRKVEEYYNNLYKMDNAVFRCCIYPVWMPKYRMFTCYDVLKYFKIIKNSKEMISKVSHHLPSFLTSYKNCNIDGQVVGLEYKVSSRPLNQFWDGIYQYLENIEFDLGDKEWVSFVVSPVEILLDKEDRCISNLTEWTCFSLIGRHLVSDFEYAFDVGANYVYSYKVRAMSDDQEFFVHSSGDYAVECFATGFSFHTRRADFELKTAIQNKSYCALDISKCSPKEIERLVEWCHENQVNFIELDDDKDMIFISHPRFCVMESGLLMPGISTWSDWDDLNFDSVEFLSKIPFGNVLDEATKTNLFNKYYPNSSKITDLCLLRYSQVVLGEAIKHDERTVRFVAYIGSIDAKECELYVKQARKQIKSIIKVFKMYVTPYEDITDIVLEAQPNYNQSIRDIIESLENIFHELVLSLRDRSTKCENMAYYVKYLLQRYIPDNIINN